MLFHTRMVNVMSWWKFTDRNNFNNRKIGIFHMALTYKQISEIICFENRMITQNL